MSNKNIIKVIKILQLLYSVSFLNCTRETLRNAVTKPLRFVTQITPKLFYGT